MNPRILTRLIDHCHTVEPVAGQRHAACITYKDSIISIGNNSYKSHPIQAKYGKNERSIYLHAEIDAIVKSLSRIELPFLSKCAMYVVRLNKKGQLASSCPCKRCMKAIEEFNIGCLYHS